MANAKPVLAFLMLISTSLLLMPAASASSCTGTGIALNNCTGADGEDSPCEDYEYPPWGQWPENDPQDACHHYSCYGSWDECYYLCDDPHAREHNYKACDGEDGEPGCEIDHSIADACEGGDGGDGQGPWGEGGNGGDGCVTTYMILSHCHGGDGGNGEGGGGNGGAGCRGALLVPGVGGCTGGNGGHPGGNGGDGCVAQSDPGVVIAVFGTCRGGDGGEGGAGGTGCSGKIVVGTRWTCEGGRGVPPGQDCDGTTAEFCGLSECRVGKVDCGLVHGQCRERFLCPF